MDLRNKHVIPDKDYGFHKVTSFIDEKIVLENQAISMQLLQDIYSKDTSSNSFQQKSKYRSKLKQKIISTYGDKLLFISPGKNVADVVINSDMIKTHLQLNEKENSIKQVASILQKDIQEYCKSLNNLNWPPTIEELTSKDRSPPNTIKLFLNQLLKPPSHNATENTQRLVDSFTDDLIHGVSNGKVITPKHFLLGLGLHSITGQKKVIQIINKLGHSISYDQVCDIEFAQAQKAKIKANENSGLSLLPATKDDIVSTVFWVDNLDIKVERQTGGGIVNMTTMMAFQEVSDKSVVQSMQYNIDKSNSKSLEQNTGNLNIYVNEKKEPPILPFPKVNSIEHSNLQEEFSMKYLLWFCLRNYNRDSQIIPSFSGWLVNLRTRQLHGKISETIETYLPPIASKVTEWQTIYKYFTYLQNLAMSVNMPYVNITLDCGAALNAYKLIWNYAENFQNIFVHLGDFHFMKENFKVIGYLMRDSGFEDIVYQAGICTSGSIEGAMLGSHYNKAWFIHSNMVEGMERLLFRRFLEEENPEIPSTIINVDSEIDITTDLIESIKSIYDLYEMYKSKVRNGWLGKTPQFWIMYIDVIMWQIMSHTSVQENNFDLRLECWQKFLPTYFVYNMVNYARYGSYYVFTLKNIDNLYPGMRKLFDKTGFSVQGQNRYLIRTAIDQRGEQTINRDAKTSGGIKAFSTNQNSVLKWCLNRAEAGHNTKSLLHMAGLGEDASKYKPLRPAQILLSEKLVTNIQNVLDTEFINPFDVCLEKSQLLNLSSGVPLPEETAEEILKTFEVGKKLSDDFQSERLSSKTEFFHLPIKRYKYASFSKKMSIVKKDDKSRVIEINRNILGSLLSFSVKTEKAINFKKALCFPLNPVPLSICHPDGNQRVTSKAKLKNIILQHKVIEDNEMMNDSNFINNFDFLVLDMIAHIHTLSITSGMNYQNLADNFLRSLPVGYSTVVLVADVYRETSIKNMKRKKSGESKKVLMKSLKSKSPPEFSKIMNNNENKTRLLELISEYIQLNKIKVLNNMRCNKILISLESKCLEISRLSSTINISLSSSQEEADTKVIMHTYHILSESPQSIVTLRSPSGDTDIVVLAVTLLNEFNNRVIFDDGVGKNRLIFKLSDIHLNSDIIEMLIGFHSFTGNDYVSSFFRKGKESCFQIQEKYHKFRNTFQQLGESWELSDELFSELEEFVCHLYGSCLKDINDVRYCMFHKKYAKEKKAIDMSIVPPCKSVLHLHCKRANHVAGIWKRSKYPNFESPPITYAGWLNNGNIKWVESEYPSDIEDILLDDNYNPIDEYSEEVESDDE